MGSRFAPGRGAAGPWDVAASRSARERRAATDDARFSIAALLRGRGWRGWKGETKLEHSRRLLMNTLIDRCCNMKSHPKSFKPKPLQSLSTDDTKHYTCRPYHHSYLHHCLPSPATTPGADDLTSCPAFTPSPVSLNHGSLLLRCSSKCLSTFFFLHF